MNRTLAILLCAQVNFKGLFFPFLSRLGEELRRGLSGLFDRHGYRARVTGETSFFKVHFTDQEVVDYRGARKGVNKEEERKIFFHLLNRGIFVESQIKGCLSVPMGRAEIHALLEAMEDYLKKQRGV